MSFCPSIEIFPTAPFYFITSDGRVILDIDEGTTVSLSKLLKLEDDVYSIGSIEDLEITIPNSAKNFFYLKHMVDPATEKGLTFHIDVRISLGSETLYHDRLYVINKTHQSIVIKLVYSANWKTALQKLYIKDLPLGGFNFTKTYVEQVKTNNALYNDGDIGHWFPDVDYGGWRENGKIVVEDNRPFIHSLFIMQKMFESIGWCLEFPFYETTLGRRCIDYILKDDYGDSEQLKTLRRFNAQKEYVPNTVWAFGQVAGWNEFHDPGNSFDAGLGIYDNVFEGKFKVNVLLTGSSTLLLLKFRLIKRRFNFGVDEISLLGEWNVPLYSSPSNHVFEVETTVTPSEQVFLLVESEGLTSIVGPCNMTINFSNEVNKTFYAKGDFIDLPSVVDQGLTCYDYLLGNIHFCAGIIDEYPQYKKVRILTPFDADIFGESVEGYFQNTFETLRSKQPINTTNSAVRNDGQLRYLKVAFAKTTDEVTKGAPYDSSEIYSKTIDLGEPYIVDVEEVRNPLFEFTVLRPENNFVHQSGSSFGDPGYYMLPQLTDNNDGKVSLNIAPRKLIAFGYDKQFNVDRGVILWENEAILKLAFAAQDASGILFGDPGVQPTLRLTYGNTVNDLWSLVLSRYYIQFRQRLQLDLLANLSNEDFFGFNQRKKYEIDYDGHPVIGRIVAINDYQPCNILSAQLILLPELLAGELCNESDEEPTCANNPFIIETFDAGTNCWTFAIGGEFDCNIVTITWLIQYASDDPATWTEIGTGSTVEVCDAVEWFIIRALITYDCEECPSSDISKYIEPCTGSISCTLTQLFNPNDFQQWIAFQLNASVEGCDIEMTLQVYLDGELIDTIVSVNGSFGQGSINLASGTWYFITPVTNQAFYILTIVVDCDNGCPDLETQCTYTGQGAPPPPNGCDLQPGLVCIPVTVMGQTCYTWVLENAGDYQYFVVTWECADGTGGQWMPGDPPVCCSGFLEANAMVHYCNCDPICTPYVSCDPGGCMVADAGTPLQFIVCN